MNTPCQKPQRQMKLSLFLTGDGNYHMAGWRLPGSTSDGGENIQRWFEAAQTVERGKLHMLFIADAASPPGTDDLETLSLTARIDRMDPIPDPVGRFRGDEKSRPRGHHDDDLPGALQPGAHHGVARSCFRRPRRLEHRDRQQQGRRAPIQSRMFTCRMASATIAPRNSSMSCAESGTATTMTRSRATRNRASICVPTRCISSTTRANISRFAAPRPFRARRRAIPC